MISRVGTRAHSRAWERSARSPQPLSAGLARDAALPHCQANLADPKRSAHAPHPDRRPRPPAAARGRRAARPRRPRGRRRHRERLSAAAVRRPRHRRGDRLGIRRDGRDRQAAELDGQLPEHLLGRDDPGGLRGPVRHRHDRHHHPRRPQGEGGLLRPLHALGDVHAGARRRGPLRRRGRLHASTTTCWSAPRPAPRRSTSRSTMCSTATRRTRASSCSRPSAPRCRRCGPATSTWC